MRRAILCSVVLGAILAAMPAFSQGDELTSRALYQDGMRLVKEGQVEAGCSKLQESLRQNYSLNVQYYHGDCLEKLGKTASAWLAFANVAAKAKVAGMQDKALAAKARADALEPQLPKLSISVSANEPGLEIRRDGVVVVPAVWGTPVPLDPGVVMVVASAPGRKSWSATVALEKGRTTPLAVPPLEAAATTSAASVATPSGVATSASSATLGSTTTSASAPSRVMPSEGGSVLRTVGWIAAGVGVASLAGGFAVGGVVIGKADEANAYCRTSTICRDQRGIDLRNDAIGLGNLSTALVIAGGVALVGGVVLVLTAPSGSKPLVKDVSVKWNLTGMSVEGSF